MKHENIVLKVGFNPHNTYYVYGNISKFKKPQIRDVAANISSKEKSPCVEHNIYSKTHTNHILQSAPVCQGFP